MLQPILGDDTEQVASFGEERAQEEHQVLCEELRWPRSVGQVGGEDKLFPGSDYAASFRLDAVAGAGPGDGVEPIS